MIEGGREGEEGSSRGGTVTVGNGIETGVDRNVARGATNGPPDNEDCESETDEVPDAGGQGNTPDNKGPQKQERLDVDKVLEEWKNCGWKTAFQKAWREKRPTSPDNFTVTTFLIGIVLSAFHFYDFIVDNQLGWEYILGDKPRGLFYGVITLLIPFLPGIRWYASVKTEKHHFARFVTSLFFPFFMIVFKVTRSYAALQTTTMVNFSGR